MQKQVTKLIWRRHRRTFVLAGLLSLLVAVANDLITLHGLNQTQGHYELVKASINHWEVYNTSNFPAYSFWLLIVAWLLGLVLMNQDLTDNFNQFLFSSGFSRQRVYWTKLWQGLLAMLVIVSLTLAVQYGIFWVSLPARIGFHLAWPGLITSWGYGLAGSLGMFAMCWFAALIVGQTGALVVTLIGFTLSLSGVAAIFEQLDSKGGLGWDLNGAQWAWLSAGSWVVAALILFIWGAYLYQHLSLEHNGEYLLFPGLRVPVYIVFVVYVTGINGFNGTDTYSTIISFLVSAAFGYFWLWRPGIMAKWHRWRSQREG